MRIYKPRGLTNGQIALVTILGVLGGIYIWRPLFDELYPRRRKTEVAEVTPDSKVE